MQTIVQGRRNSIISGEATSNIAIFFALFPKKLVCQPLISGEAAASPASPVPTPLITFDHINISLEDLGRYYHYINKYYNHRWLKSENSISSSAINHKKVFEVVIVDIEYKMLIQYN